MASSIDPPVWFITGCSTGLGRALAERVLEHGHHVVVTARTPKQIEDIVAAYPEGTLALPLDVCDASQIASAVEQAEKRFGRIDVLVNNAGYGYLAAVEEGEDDEVRAMFEANFFGLVAVTKQVLPGMRARGRGRIVNITSIGGKISVPHLLPYSASKFALVGFSQGLRAEVAKDGIVVTTICPGLMRTGSPRNASFKGQHRAEYTWFSISDSLPAISMDSRRAARQIVEACRAGAAEVVLSLPAATAARIHGLFPALTANVLAVVNRLLPGPGGVGSRSVKGWQSFSSWSPSWLTRAFQSPRASSLRRSVRPRAEAPRPPTHRVGSGPLTRYRLDR